MMAPYGVSDLFFLASERSETYVIDCHRLSSTSCWVAMESWSRFRTSRAAGDVVSLAASEGLRLASFFSLGGL